MANPHQVDDFCTDFENGLRYIQRATEKLRVHSSEKANEVARLINRAAEIVMEAAVEYNMLELSPPGNPDRVAVPPFAPATEYYSPSYPRLAPTVPPGLGYDDPRALHPATQGYMVVGGGYGYEPPLARHGETSARYFVPTMPRAMVTPIATMIPQMTNTPTGAQQPYGHSNYVAEHAGSAGSGQSGDPRAASNLPLHDREYQVTDVLHQVVVPRVSIPTALRARQGSAPLTNAPQTAATDSATGQGTPTRQPGLTTGLASGSSTQRARMTWAKIAAAPAPGGAPSAAQTAGPSNPNPQEPPAEQKRVVWIRGCTSRTSLSFVTAQIHEGPLVSVVIDVDPLGSPPADTDRTPRASAAPRAACVIFYSAAHAAEFVRANRLLENECGHTRYGPGHAVGEGAPWPMDDEIRAMAGAGMSSNAPTGSATGSTTAGHQRRRLTITGQGLFARVPKRTFEAEIKRVAGERNVELIWLYNTGNATVVLASVRVARAVRDALLAKVRDPNNKAWDHNVGVTFASDPCETTVVYRTQLRSPQ